MCIKSAPYMHQKSANLALNIVLFLYFCANVVHQIAPLESAVPSVFSSNFDAKLATKYNANLSQTAQKMCIIYTTAES